MTESKEYSTIIKCEGMLETALKNDKEITHFFHLQGFITSEDYENITGPTSRLSVADKAVILVAGIRDRVKLNPENYHKFIDHLRLNKRRHGDILAILEREYSSPLNPATACTGDLVLCPQTAIPIRGRPRLIRQGSSYYSPEDIKRKMKDLQKLFNRIAFHTLDKVKELGIGVDHLIARLIALPAEHIEEHEDFLKQLDHDLDHKSGIMHIWMKLSRYWNFLNYNLLDNFICNLEDKVLEEEMDTYLGFLREFRCKTRLCDFAKCCPVVQNRPSEDNLREFVFHLNEDWETCTLETLESLRGGIIRKFLLPSFAVLLDKVTLGSIRVTWLLPAQINWTVMLKKIDVRELDKFGIKSISAIDVKVDASDDIINDVYPDQVVICKFTTDYLTIGKDYHYYWHRDYNARNIPLAEGAFGAIYPAEDLTSKHLFAIRQNNRDEEDIITSISREAVMLAHLGPHSNVIQMYGAVLDTQELLFHPTRICKLMMELAEHGNLSDMLKDPETDQPSPLESDQALYYFQQLLEGVQFLHKNNVMHLDIKGLNLLIFNEGRTLKICDFGNAIRSEEVTALAGKNLRTPQFASPEICRLEEPHFSSDIWSAMCVLVEMLTAMKPWDHRISRDTTHYHLIFMVGRYRDEQMKEDLIPNSETLDPSILDLMGLVFRTNHQERPTAMELLTHPLIHDAYTYESCFDELVDEYHEEQEVSYPTHVEAPTSLPLRPPQGTNPDDSLSNLEQKLIETDSRLGIDEDPKRISTDNGMGIDEDRGSVQYLDSGLDTPYTAEKTIFGGKFNFSAFPEESDTDDVKVDASDDIIDDVYPDQVVICKFTTDYLTIGKDYHYYRHRDYNARNIPLAEGAFGAIYPAEDLTSKHLFAIRQNNRDEEDIITSISREAVMLAHLGPHTNVIQMYGAVLDTQELLFHPTRICKLMMELAEHGNLSDMLKDPETDQPSPLESDQALYYFQQLLEGVQFLHKNNVMHLDIKGLNLLIFNEGRTLKICDFGTALRVEEVAASAGKNLGTPQFASPEICRQEEPHFSSDIWSAMCVLVEMLTAMKPWDHRISRDTTHYHLIFMIGLYRDEQMKKDLIPNSETLDPSILDLMGLVFRTNHQERPTAMELLTHPLIHDAYTYESCFDELVDEYHEEQEVSYPTHVEAPTSLPLRPPQGTNPDNSLSNLEQKLIGTDSRLGIDEDPKRISTDNGMGIDEDRGSVQYTRRKYSKDVNLDSGLDTPYTAEKTIFGGKFNFSAFPEESDTDYTDSERGTECLTPYSNNPSVKRFYSLPNLVHHAASINRVKRSFSSTLPNSPVTTYSMSSPSRSKDFRHICDSNPRHSNSAPAVDCPYRRRRLSLQSYGHEEVWSVPPYGKLKRTCSEINYADKGPEVASPHNKRKVPAPKGACLCAGEMGDLEWRERSGYVRENKGGDT